MARRTNDWMIKDIQRRHFAQRPSSRSQRSGHNRLPGFARDSFGQQQLRLTARASPTINRSKIKLRPQLERSIWSERYHYLVPCCLQLVRGHEIVIPHYLVPCCLQLVRGRFRDRPKRPSSFLVSKNENRLLSEIGHIFFILGPEMVPRVCRYPWYYRRLYSTSVYVGNPSRKPGNWWDLDFGSSLHTL